MCLNNDYVGNILIELSKRKNSPPVKWFLRRYPDFVIYLNSWSEDNGINSLTFREKLYLFVNGLNNRNVCNCGNFTKFVSSVYGYREYCSTRCVMLDVKNVEKIKKTCNIIYGVDNVSKSDFIKSKKVKTSIDNYGVAYNSQRLEVRDKLSNSMKLVSKVLNDSQRTSHDVYIKNKLISLNAGVSYIKYDENKLYVCYCDIGHEFSISKNTLNDRIRNGNKICTVCNKRDNKSDSENQLFEFIKSVVGETVVESNRRILDGKELDVYLPELNLAFEYNGLYWHSDKYKCKNYHLDKTQKCDEKKIHLIHIYEDEWLYKNDIVKSNILKLIGCIDVNIMANDCVINEISSSDARLFFDVNHLSGYSNSSVKLGLFYVDKLVSVMLFNVDVKSKLVYKLVGFCELLYTNVVDYELVLFQYLIDVYKYVDIKASVDRSWCDVGLYESIGFERVGETKPDYHYVSGLKKYDKRNSIIDVTKMNKIYNCGNIKFSYKNVTGKTS